MMRIMIRSPLCALVSGLLLSACGGVPEEGQSPEEEALGTQESELCSSATVTSVSVQGVSTYGGLMAGAGSYSVDGGANGVRLEYYVDGVQKYYEERQGVSSTWNYSWAGVSCGQHSFQVKAIPMILGSDGTRATCSSISQWSSVYYPSEPCPNPRTTFSCTRTSTTQVKCTGGASGGSGTYTPMWQESYSGYPYGWYDGTWTRYFSCRSTSGTICYRSTQKQAGSADAQMLPPDDGTCEPLYPESVTFEFKVRDSNGAMSSVKSATYTCYM